MRKPDMEVREVVCSETGKPMPKIPLWMADIKVKFVSDEARQKHPTAIGLADVEPRRSVGVVSDLDDTKDLDVVDVAIDEPEEISFEELDPDEAVEDEYEA